MTIDARKSRWAGLTAAALLLLVTSWLAGCAVGQPAMPERPAGAATPATDATAADRVSTPEGQAPAATALAESTPGSAAPTAEPTGSVGAAPSAAVPRPTATVQPPASTPTRRPDLGADIRLALQATISGLERPVFLTHAGDGSGRLFVVEKPGVVRVAEGGQLLATPYLDIRDRVRSSGSEQGLLGLAFAPDHATSGVFFVNYTDRAGDTVISRFRVTGDRNLADPASEFTVLRIDQPAANHNGGMLAFGPDGYLYIGTGDGGAANDRFGNGQNPQSLLGKMLRIDVTADLSAPYLVPSDNPWAGADWNGQPVRPEIWAFGLRNPWRYAFDRASGDLWIADVGQNEYEEINLVRADDVSGLRGGLNFGWPIMEGTHCFPDSADCRREGLVLPVADYRHGADGCSVTGGYVYRGREMEALQGIYIYGDYCSGRIWGLAPDSGGAWQTRLLLDTDLSISSFGEDEAGELYVVDLNGGAVYRLVTS